MHNWIIAPHLSPVYRAFTGSRGRTGPQGQTGPRGFTGFGLRGRTGPQGKTGPRGFTGVGLRGKTGPQGKAGPQGKTGPRGFTGLQGRPGTQGKTGLQGRPGAQGSRGKDAQVEFTTISVPTFLSSQDAENCDLTDTEVPVIKGTESSNQIIFQGLANIQKNQCDDSKKDCVAAIPLSWQIRPEGNRPQLIIQFGEELENNKIGAPHYPITIPHYKGTKLEAGKSPIPSYIKGDWEQILVLSDNSKVTINAKDKEEADKVINSILPLIKPEFVVGNYQKGGFIRSGEPLKQVKVIAKLGKYFPQGQKNALPDWIVKLYE